MHTTAKVALVIGASSGFGLTTAARLSTQGFLVFGTSRAPLHNEASSVELLPLDVTSDILDWAHLWREVSHAIRVAARAKPLSPRDVQKE